MEAYTPHTAHAEGSQMLSLTPTSKSPVAKHKKVSDGSKAASGRPEGYSRKAKSLSLLCENFIARFGAPGSVISLDGSAKALGVERRRIYDIVNVLESVKVVTKVQKNQYNWHGMERLAPALEELRAEAETELAEVGASGAEGLLALDERKEKSMTRLSQRFVQMFMLSKSKALGLDEAARALLGGSDDAGLFKTKVRRLYDIANILSALQLIEKAHVGEKGKPGFRWLGPEAVVAAAARSSAVAAAAAAAAVGPGLEGASEEAAVAALHAHFQRNSAQPMLQQHAGAAAAAAAAAAALWNGTTGGAGADHLALAQIHQLQPLMGDPSRPLGILPGQAGTENNGVPSTAGEGPGAVVPSPPTGEQQQVVGSDHDPRLLGEESVPPVKRPRIGSSTTAGNVQESNSQAAANAAAAAAAAAAANLVLGDAAALLGADPSAAIAVAMQGALGSKLPEAQLAGAPHHSDPHHRHVIESQDNIAQTQHTPQQRGKVHPLARFMELENSARQPSQQLDGGPTFGGAYNPVTPASDPLTAAAGVWGWDALGMNGWMGPQLSNVYWQLAQQQAAAGAASLQDQLQALTQSRDDSAAARGGALPGSVVEPAQHDAMADGSHAVHGTATANVNKSPGEYSNQRVEPVFSTLAAEGAGLTLGTGAAVPPAAAQFPDSSEPRNPDLMSVQPSLEPLAVALQLGLPLPGSQGDPGAASSDDAAVLADGSVGDAAAAGAVPLQYLQAWTYYNMYNPWIRQPGSSGDEMLPNGAQLLEQAGQGQHPTSQEATLSPSNHESLHV